MALVATSSSETGSGTRSLRTSTVETALAERPSGLTLSALTDRLSPPFDLGDVLVVLRRRPDIFVEWDGRWLSRAASLLQGPRRLDWNVLKDDLPREWLRFQNPRAAAAGWMLFRERLHELAFDPNTAHIEMNIQADEFPGLRLHVDHTVLLERPTWIIWALSDDLKLIDRLEAAGFFMWDPRDPEALVDVRHRIPRGKEGTEKILLTWTLGIPLELAEALTWLLIERLNILNPKTVARKVDRVAVPPQEARAFGRARAIWERRRRGATLAYCEKCGNALSDPNSVALGYGPECAARMGLGTVQALARGRDGVLFMGAVPLSSVRQRMALELGSLNPPPTPVAGGAGR